MPRLNFNIDDIVKLHQLNRGEHYIVDGFDFYRADDDRLYYIDRDQYHGADDVEFIFHDVTYDLYDGDHHAEQHTDDDHGPDVEFNDDGTVHVNHPGDYHFATGNSCRVVGWCRRPDDGRWQIEWTWNFERAGRDGTEG